MSHLPDAQAAYLKYCPDSHVVTTDRQVNGPDVETCCSSAETATRRRVSCLSKVVVVCCVYLLFEKLTTVGAHVTDRGNGRSPFTIIRKGGPPNNTDVSDYYRAMVAASAGKDSGKSYDKIIRDFKLRIDWN